VLVLVPALRVGLGNWWLYGLVQMGVAVGRWQGSMRVWRTVQRRGKKKLTLVPAFLLRAL